MAQKTAGPQKAALSPLATPPLFFSIAASISPARTPVRSRISVALSIGLFVMPVTAGKPAGPHIRLTKLEAAMFSTQGNTQVYSPFGTYVVEQHGADCLKRHVDLLPRPDVTFGVDHPLGQQNDNVQKAA
jgi:hypothetical protein